MNSKQERNKAINKKIMFGFLGVLLLFIFIGVISGGEEDSNKQATNASQSQEQTNEKSKTEESFMDSKRKCTVMEAFDIHTTGFGTKSDNAFNDGREFCEHLLKDVYKGSEVAFMKDVDADWSNRKHETIDGKDMTYYLGILGWQSYFSGKQRFLKANNPPKYHHYVPKTYLKHWLDNQGLVYIYNKKNHTINPSSIDGQYFGKNHLNTITYPDNTKGYWVESALAELEGKITPTLNKIATSNLESSGKITYEDKLMLSMFVSAQFWRLPANQNFIENQIANGDFKSLYLSVISEKSGDKLSNIEIEQFYNRISKTDLFKKAYPILRSLVNLLDKNAFDALRGTWQLYYQEPGRHLTSDNPILYTKEPTPSTVFEDFILPLSPSVLLISSRNCPDEISATNSTALNMLQIHHANQFVACNDKNILQMTTDLYKDNFADKSLKDMEAYVYKEIFGQ